VGIRIPEMHDPQGFSNKPRGFGYNASHELEINGFIGDGGVQLVGKIAVQ
jgi:hypothetical protein